MKSQLVILFLPVVAATSLAMDHVTIGISKVFDTPTGDTHDLVLKHNGAEETVHVDREPALCDRDVAEIAMAEGDDVSILITLTEDGAAKFADLTEEMVGKRLAVTANNKLLTAPVVQQEVRGGSIQIHGNLSRKEAEELIRRFYEAKAKRDGVRSSGSGNGLQNH